MRVLLLSNYYYPETVGAGIWVRQLATDLRDRGHQVTVLTSFPSYPAGTVFADYRRKRRMRETVDGIEVLRTLTYATTAKNFWPRFLSFGTFCASSMLDGAFAAPQVDVIYAILPPLPLGVSACALSRGRTPVVVNIQDIYPEVAVATGYLTNRRAVRFFERMERWIYAQAAQIVVISEGFRENLRGKGVPDSKIAVAPNWADEAGIRPGPRDNAFRSEAGAEADEFLVLYSGGLTHNSNLEPVLLAARELAGEPFRFAIVGDGVHKEKLERMAAELQLNNMRFLPFQPLERYPEALAAADATVVTLHSKAAFASVPSKIYKQMAAARPIVAITNVGNELTRLLEASRCGVAVSSDNVPALVATLRRAAAAPAEFARLGWNGRQYLENECSRARSIDIIEATLLRAAGTRERRLAAANA